jgi:hypothetical protein
VTTTLMRVRIFTLSDRICRRRNWKVKVKEERREIQTAIVAIVSIGVYEF